jgi:hypothetical protein
VATGAGRRPRGSGAASSRIHEGLVGPRALIGTPYLGDPELRRQYALEIAPRTRAALGKVLAELFGEPGGRVAGWPASAPRALDLGAGTGAAGDAIRARFGEATPVVAVDRVAAIPGVVAADLSAGGPLRGVEGRFDLIVAAHLLNELFVDRSERDRIAARARLVAGWCDLLLAQAGTLVIIEPALRETSRELLAVRDQLLSAGLRVVAPCFWTGPCPALLRERDWCHDAAPRAPTAAPGDPHGCSGRVDFSYLALRAQAPAAEHPEPGLFRIVSDPLVEKGRLRLFGCGPTGRHPLVRLDRHRTPANAPFDGAERGGVLRVAGATEAGDGLRIGAETVVALGRLYVPAE